MPRLFFPGVIGDTQRLQMRHAFEGKIPNEKGKGLERVGNLLLRSKAKSLPSKQSKKFKCQIWPKITNKIAKKCLDVSSL